MELESPSPYPQVPATSPYPEPTPSSPHEPLQLSEDPSYFKYPAICPYFIYGCVILPLETLPPPTSGDPSVGVVYLRIVLSPEEVSQLMGNT
jgi:hypothetical protein